jgi:hypothetical protein
VTVLIGDALLGQQGVVRERSLVPDAIEEVLRIRSSVVRARPGAAATSASVGHSSGWRTWIALELLFGASAERGSGRTSCSHESELLEPSDYPCRVSDPRTRI